MSSPLKQDRTANLIMRYVSEIIRTEVNADLGFITITGCKVNADISVAKVYISFLGVTNKEKKMESLNSVKGFIRRELAHKIELRKVPELEFILDDSLDKGEQIEEILKNSTK